jgi:hypothetical protein
LGLAYSAARCDPVNEISFIHVSSWGGFLLSQRLSAPWLNALQFVERGNSPKAI